MRAQKDRKTIIHLQKQELRNSSYKNEPKSFGLLFFQIKNDKKIKLKTNTI